MPWDSSMLNLLTSKKFLAALCALVLLVLIKPYLLGGGGSGGGDLHEDVERELLARFQYEGALFKMPERVTRLVCIPPSLSCSLSPSLPFSRSLCPNQTHILGGGGGSGGVDLHEDVERELLARFQYEGALFKMRERVTRLLCSVSLLYTVCFYMCVRLCLPPSLSLSRFVLIKPYLLGGGGGSGGGDLHEDVERELLARFQYEGALFKM